MAANPTLINGFEDVMKFISQQADRIKKLQEENEEHKTTILSLKTSVDDLREARDMRDSKIKNLMDENKKLKIEMGEELDIYELDLDEAHTDYEHLKEEKKKLEEKNERMEQYIESREVKYCEKCLKYGDEDIDIFSHEDPDDECDWICETCKEH